MSQWRRCDLKCWTLDVGRWALGVEKEPRRLLTPEYKFIERPEEAPASVGLRAGSQSPRRYGVAYDPWRFGEPPLPVLAPRNPGAAARRPCLTGSNFVVFR